MSRQLSVLDDVEPITPDEVTRLRFVSSRTKLRILAKFQELNELARAANERSLEAIAIAQKVNNSRSPW